MTEATADNLIGYYGRCAHCRLSVRVIESALPSVCPFCHREMETSTFTPKPATPEHEDVLRGISSQVYRRPPRPIILLLMSFIILLLSIVVYLKILNLENYWYQPWVNTYSIIVGIFIASRFLLAAF